MPHVLIENGVAVQLDLTGSPPQGYVECGPEVQPGFIDNGDGTFSAPEPEYVDYEEPDPIIRTVAQSRLNVADENIEVVGDGAGGVAGAFVLASGLAWVQLTKDQGTTDYVVQAFGTGLYRCYVPVEEQFSDGFMLVSTDFDGVPAFPDCVTVIVTRT